MNTFAFRCALLAIAVSSAGTALAFAQDNNAPTASSSNAPPSSAPMHQAPDPQKQANHLTKRLGLSADQSSKLLTILQNRQQQMAAVRGDNTLSAQDRHSKMRSIQQDGDSQINAMLTPAQQTQYANMKQMQRQHMQNAHGQGSPSSQPGNSSGSSDNGNSGGN